MTNSATPFLSKMGETMCVECVLVSVRVNVCG